MPTAPEHRSYHHGDLRNCLLSAADDLLREQGTAGLSLRAVARRAGVSHSAPYRHFADKQALLQALAERGVGRLRESMTTAARAVPHGPEQQLIAAGTAYVTWVLAQPELARLLYCIPAPATEPGKDPLCVLGDIIMSGIHAGVFRPRDARELALTAWSSFHGLAMLLVADQLGKDAVPQETHPQLVAAVGDNVLYGLAR